MTMHCACNCEERECNYPDCHTGKKINKPRNAPAPLLLKKLTPDDGINKLEKEHTNKES
jgi:hypothetical protein